MQFKTPHRDRASISRRKQSITLRVGAVAAATALLFSSGAHADSYNWTGLYPTGDWDAVFLPPFNGLPGNWLDNTSGTFSPQVPGASDDITFGGASYIPLGVNMTGPHSVNSISFDTPQSFIINNSGGLDTALTLTSGSLAQTANSTGTQTISVPVTIGASAVWALNGSGTIVASQLISSNNLNFGLTTTGVGNLTLGGQNTYRGSTAINGSGTVTLMGSIGVATGGAAPGNLYVSSVQGANFVLASAATDASALITGQTYVAGGQTGTFTQNGGTHTASGLAVGYTPGANGTYNLGAGTLTVTSDGTLVGGEGSAARTQATTSGVFNQSGGLHQTRQLELGAAQSGSGTYNLSGGTLSVGQATFIGETTNSTGLFTQTGGQNFTQALVLGVSIQYVADPVMPLSWNRLRNIRTYNPTLGFVAPASATAATATASAKYVLSGGTLSTEVIEGLSTGTEFDFNGGTLKPTIGLNNFITGLDAAYVQAGGAVIDTAGFNITVAQPLLHDPAMGTQRDGGLTKNGIGFLTLTGTPTYSGPTVVNGGTLTIPFLNSQFQSASYTSNVGGNLILQGGSILGNIFDSGTVAVTKFQSFGTIRIAGGAHPATFYDDATDLELSSLAHMFIGTVGEPGGSLLLQNGANLQLKGTLVNNGTVSGTVIVNSSGILSGSGKFDSIVVAPGGKLHPGNSPGTMHTTEANLVGGSLFQFDINAATGTAGTNWSLLAVDDTLTIGTLTGTSHITLKLTSVLGQGDIEAALTDFDPSKSYSWQFASFGALVVNGATFTVDASAFANVTNGGTFSVVSDAGSLSLDFTAVPVPVPAPEPTSLLLAGFAGVACLGRRRRLAR